MYPIYSASNNIEVSMGSDTDEVIDELFDAMLQRFQEERETSFEKGNEFIFENVHLLKYYFQKIDIRRSGLYIVTPEWLKNKEATINPKITDDDNCFQYSITIALDHKDIGKDPQRIKRIKPYITKYNWRGNIFRQGYMTGNNFNKIMTQLHLIYYVYLTILKKYIAFTNQNITMNIKIK